MFVKRIAKVDDDSDKLTARLIHLILDAKLTSDEVQTLSRLFQQVQRNGGPEEFALSSIWYAVCTIGSSPGHVWDEP